MNANQQTQNVSHPVGMTPGTVPAQYSNQPWANSAHAAPSALPYPSPPPQVPQGVGSYTASAQPVSVVDETLTVSAGMDSVPPGAYTARLVDYLSLQMTSQFADGPQEKRRLVFEVVQGAQAGKRVDVLANATFSPKSTLYRWATTLLGRQLQVGESFSFKQLIGQHFSIIVTLNERGYGKLTAAIPLDPQQ